MHIDLPKLPILLQRSTSVLPPNAGATLSSRHEVLRGVVRPPQQKVGLMGFLLQTRAKALADQAMVAY